MSPKQLQALKKKINWQYGHHMGGYLTPVEIVHIVEKMEEVIIPRNSKVESQYNTAKEQVKKGISDPTWFYFDVKHVGRFYGLTP